MDNLRPAAIVLGILVVIYLAMAAAWRARRRRDASIAPGYRAPDTAVQDLASIDAFYVATTRHGEPLERLTIPGLAFRGRAVVDITSAGVTISVTGEQSVYVPGSAIVETAGATVAIDRVVEPGGLVMVAWRPDAPVRDAPAEAGAASDETRAGEATGQAAIVDSYFRVIEPSDRAKMIAIIGDISPETSEPSKTRRK